MTPSNRCGDCDLCCRLLAIEELDKAAGRLCAHHLGGCAIYEARPASCRGFRCLWLKSESLEPAFRMGPDWRPDRANFTMYSERNDMRLNVVVEPHDALAWAREPYYGYLKRVSLRAREGFQLVVHVGERRIVIFPEADLDLGHIGPEQQIVSGYIERDGRMIPYATVSTAPRRPTSQALLQSAD